MDRVTVLGRLLLVLTPTDGILALALALLLMARAGPYRDLVALRAYRWIFTVGLLFSLGWWALLFCWLYASQGHEGPEGLTAFKANAILPVSILGAEAGVAGFIGLSMPWKLFPLAFGILSGFLTVMVGSWLMGQRLLR